MEKIETGVFDVVRGPVDLVPIVQSASEQLNVFAHELQLQGRLRMKVDDVFSAVTD